MGALRMMILTLTVTVTMGQYRQAQPAYDEYETAYDAPRQAQPTPRSYASGSPAAQRQSEPAAPKPTPVAILKQINRHNEDGSYTYGFEGADGSFKIETKLANGDVKGKYGFVDDGGKVRVVEYGADQYGFQPAGEGITVAPPTLVDDSTSKEALQIQNQSLDYQDYQQQQPATRPAPQRPIPQIAPAPSRPIYRPPPQQAAPQQYQNENLYAREQSPLQRPVFSPAPQQSQILRSQNDYEPAPVSQAYNQGPVQFNPAPVRESAPAQAPAHAQPHQARAAPGGILDQLARDYALPQGSSPPLHDISFGYY